MNKYILLFSFIIVILSLPFVTCLASEFECAFIEEKYKGGASNRAECTSNPQAMKLWANPTLPKKWEHCKNEEVYSYADLVDFYINESMISWTKKVGATEYAKQNNKEYWLKLGYSERDAQKNADIFAKTKEFREEFPVKHHFVGEEAIVWDSMKQKPYDKPLEGECHIFIFGDNKTTYSLYIPHNNKAILSIYIAIAEDSTIWLRFGECRKVKE